MKYRTTEILDASDPSAATGTIVVPLNIQDPISRITLFYKVQLLSKATIAHFAANITKIELTDGSDVIYSLSGYECQALAVYDRRVNAMNGPDYIAGSWSTAMFPIDFGRFKFDQQLALVPAHFHNLLLKVTYNEDLVDAAVANHYFEVFADCFDERIISPVGYLSAKEWIEYTPSGASAYKAVDLPTDEIIRRIQVRGYQEKYAPDTCCSEVRLTEEEKKRVVFDWETIKYEEVQQADEVPIIERVCEYADAAGDYNKFIMGTDYMVTYVGMPRASQNVWSPDYADGGYLLRSCGGTEMVQGIYVGRLPHHTFDFPMGNPQDLDDWYDVTSKGSVVLRLRAGAQGASCIHSVTLQQFRRY